MADDPEKLLAETRKLTDQLREMRKQKTRSYAHGCAIQKAHKRREEIIATLRTMFHMAAMNGIRLAERPAWPSPTE